MTKSIEKEPVVESQEQEQDPVSQRPVVDASAEATATEAVDGADAADSNAVEDADVVTIRLLIPGGRMIPIRMSMKDTSFILREIISDLPSCCQYSNYRLLIVESEGKKSKKTKKQNRQHLSDHIEFAQYESLKLETSKVQLVPDKYTIKLIKEQLSRFRNIVEHPRKKLDTAVVNAPVSECDSTKVDDVTLAFIKSQELPIQVNLASFYDSNKKAGEIQCFQSIDFSGFNPPTNQRQLMGDIAYLKLVTLENQIYHITACSQGFYINATRNDKFSHKPSHHPCMSTTLFDLVQSVSPLFKKSYSQLLSFAADASNDLIHLSKLSDPTALSEWDQSNLLLIDTPKLKSHQWNQTETRQEHNIDQDRATKAINYAYGIDDSNQIRDFNEELQIYHSFSSTTLDERITRARNLNKVQDDFTKAATAGAIGIVNGSILPINQADDKHYFVYVYNSIFFSAAVLDQHVNSKEDRNEVLNGVASYCVANHDLLGVKQMNRAIDQYIRNQQYKTDAGEVIPSDELKLHTLATTVVDYLGHRFIAQSIIPGILHNDNSNYLCYGTVNYGHSIANNAKVGASLQKLAPSLYLGPSLVRPSDRNDEFLTEEQKAQSDKQEDNTDVVSIEAGETVEMYTHAECKCIQGSDGRHYVLDLMRLTPYDLNYYLARGDAYTDAKQVSKEPSRPENDDAATNGDEANGENADETVHQLRIPIHQSNEYVALLRPELMRHFSNHLEKHYEKQLTQKVREKCLEEKGVEETRDKLEEEATADNSQESTEQAGDEVTETRVEKKTDELADTLKAILKDYPSFEPLAVNLNAFTTYDNGESEEELVKQRKLIKSLSDYLTNVRIPQFLEDVRNERVLVVDGHSLVKYMHKNGINVRYLGQIATSAAYYEQITHLVPIEDSNKVTVVPPLRYSMLELLEIEMVSRAVKMLLREAYAGNSQLKVAPALLLSRVLNLLLNGILVAKETVDTIPHANGKKNKKAHEADSVQEENDFAFTKALQQQVTSCKLTRHGEKGFWKLVNEKIQSRFNYKLKIFKYKGDKVSEEVSENQAKLNRAYASRSAQVLPLLRRACQMNGICIRSRVYVSTKNNQVDFSPSDILSVLPVVKSSKSSWPLPEMHELFQKAHIAISSQFDKQLTIQSAFEYANQALTLGIHVTGLANLACIKCNNLISNVFFHVNDLPNALSQQRRCLALLHRLGHMDDHIVANSYMTVALFYERAKKLENAVKYLRHAIYVYELMSGRFFAEASNSYLKLGNIYYELGLLDKAVMCYNIALDRCATDQIGMAKCFDKLSAFHAVVGDIAGYRLALHYEKQKYRIYTKLFSKDDARCVESSKNLELYTQKAVECSKQESKSKKGGSK